MSTPLARLEKLRVPVARVVHVGASSGQEVDEYREAGLTQGLFVEPLDDAYATLSRRVADVPGFVAVQAVCTAREGEQVTLHRASNAGESSSILRPDEHLRAHPNITFDDRIELRSRRLDDLAAEHGVVPGDGGPLLLVVDVQGAELQVLHGGEETLAATTAAWIEVTHASLYEGNARFEEVIDFLRPFGLELMYCNINRKLYGDALFVRIG